MSDLLRDILGDRYVETIRAAVLADNPNAIRDAQRVGGNLGELDELRLYVGVIDRRRDELAAERDELRARLDAVLALHYAAYNDLMRVRLCAMCHGKAGVHECGCWADEDYQPVCGHCLGERNASVPYPCPTRRAAEGDES